MQFKDFEIRPVKSLDGVIDTKRFELVKWYDHNPVPVTDGRTGEKKMSTRSCFVVAWLEWNAKEPCFEFKSCGLRWLEAHPDEDVENWIIKWCDYKLQELYDN